MIYFIDKFINFMVMIGILHYAWKIPYRDKRVCKVLAILSTLIASGLCMYIREDNMIIYFVWILIAMNLIFEKDIFRLSSIVIGLVFYTGMIDTISSIIIEKYIIRNIYCILSYEWFMKSAYVISIVMYVCMYYLILKKNETYMCDIQLKYKVTMLVITFIYEWVIIFIYDDFYMESGDYLYADIRFLLCGAGVILSVFITLELAVKNSMIKLQNEQLELALKTQQSQYIYLKEKTSDLRKFRHDLIKHMGCVQELLNNQEYKKANIYINRIWNVAKEMRVKVHVGDDYVDAVLNYYAYICEKEKIVFEIMGKIKASLNLDMLDITVLLGNSIQNAYEATKDIKKAFIKIEIVDHEDEIFITVRNSCALKQKKEGNILITKKKDKNNHGIGMKNIRKVIRKYDGECYISIDSLEDYDIFCLEMGLKKTNNGC